MEKSIQLKINEVISTEVLQLKKTFDVLVKDVKESKAIINLTERGKFFDIYIWDSVRNVIQVWCVESIGYLDGHFGLELTNDMEQKHQWFNLINVENCNLLVPGELTKLMDFLNVHHRSVYYFNESQRNAIEQFKKAFKRLDDENIHLLVDEENRQFLFANANGGIWLSSDPIEKMGAFEVNTDRLPRTEEQYSCDFYNGDGLYCACGE